jgi:uncharacterized protein YoaH (UPF0181 family)
MFIKQEPGAVQEFNLPGITEEGRKKAAEKEERIQYYMQSRGVGRTRAMQLVAQEKKKTVQPTAFEGPLFETLKKVAKPGEVYNPPAREPRANIFMNPHEESKREEVPVQVRTDLPF